MMLCIDQEKEPSAESREPEQSLLLRKSTSRCFISIFLPFLIPAALIGIGLGASAAGASEATIDTPYFRFSLSSSNGACEVLDKQAGVTWQGDPLHPRFGEAVLTVHETPRKVDLTACTAQTTGEGIAVLFHPLEAEPAATLRVWVRPQSDQRTLDVSYQAEPAVEVESLRLLPDLIAATDSGHGYLAIPAREGLLVPADSGLSFSHRFDTFAYEGCHMAMLGAVQNGAAVLVTWADPYVAADLKSVVDQGGGSHGQRITSTLTLTKSARAFRLHFLGKGDYVTIAQAYRQVAKETGWLVRWSEKLKTEPDRAKLFGAANIKLWSALDRRMNADSTKEESAKVNWTFAEAAQVAEHYKNDLKLERVLFTLGGWIHRGYDNQHPDILPAAPECGGDTAFADCARRILALGYLFCLHDNYQDIYRDSPSWDEKFIMKTPDQKLAKGGHWAGGTAYLTCSQMALELARRPQNLPAVKRLTQANAYFIDTTYAAGLQECFDPAHPLTRRDDMKWKEELSAYARGVFGVFGSECGREWAIPYSDFFEGLTGVSGHDYHDTKLTSSLGATVIPLFDLVYRDCIAMYGKYGYAPERAAEYVLRHISLGRPLNYHSIPPHLYWNQPAAPFPERASTPDEDPAVFVRSDNGWASGRHPLDRFIKNTCEVLTPLNQLTAQMPMTQHAFLTPDRKVQRTVFGEGANTVRVVVNAGKSPFTCVNGEGLEVILPPYGFMVESPTFIAFHASSWGGLRYGASALFTVRSLDDQPLSRSEKIRVYHGFGSDQLYLGNTTRTVSTESVF